MKATLKLGMTYDDADEVVGFYLPEEDRSTHVYVLGSSGVGKSKGLATWILGDIMNGNGCGGIDPYTQTLELVEVFRKIWNLSDDKTPRLIEILRNAVLTLIEAGGTMLDIEPLLTNKQFRKEKMKYVTYENVDSFWRDRFEKWEEKDRVANVESTLNKVS